MPKIRPIALSTRALPATVADLEAQRIVKRSITLLDEVEQVFKALFEDPTFRGYRGLDDPDEYIEGSQPADDTLAAQMIRAKAVEMNLQQIVDANLTTIATKLRAAERRVSASRNQRRMVSEPETEAAQ